MCLLLCQGRHESIVKVYSRNKNILPHLPSSLLETQYVDKILLMSQVTQNEGLICTSRDLRHGFLPLLYCLQDMEDSSKPLTKVSKESSHSRLLTLHPLLRRHRLLLTTNES